MTEKNFGIGMPKTGTSSLNVALKTLGIKSIHDPWKFRRKTWETGEYKWSKNFDALTNFGEWSFPHLDENYPNSKFILTTRDKESWLTSCGKHFSPRNEKKYKRPLDSAFKRLEIFGTKVFTTQRYSYVYDLHVKTVLDYFKNRQQNLLVLDVCAGDGWKKLCKFLEVDIPDIPFPYENRRRRKRKRKK